MSTNVASNEVIFELHQTVHRRARTPDELPCEYCGSRAAHDCDLGVTASTADGSIQIHEDTPGPLTSAPRRLLRRAFSINQRGTR